ncbi:MAG: DUF58 domain-containing protein [Microbacteriaceae bacterium]
MSQDRENTLRTTLGETQTRTTTEASSKLLDTVVWGLSFWQGLSALARRIGNWFQNILTTVGWLLLVLCIFGLVFGFVFAWVEAIFIAVFAFVLLAVSALFLLGRGDFRVELRLADTRVVAGSTVPAVLEVHNKLRRISLPSRMDIPIGAGLIELPLPFIQAGGSWSEGLEITASQRGIIPVGPISTIKGDPIGIVNKEIVWAQAREIFVHPVTIDVPSLSSGFIRDLEGSPSRTIVDSDLAFHAIREYLPGDSRRHIHWKSTAKTGQLMVRQYEETKRSRMLLAVSVNQNEYLSPDEFELALSALGSIGVRAIRDGREFQAVTSLEVPAPMQSTKLSVQNMHVQSTRGFLDQLSALNQIGSTARLEQLCQLSQLGEGLSLAFMICGSTVSLRRLQKASLKFSVDTAVIALIADQDSPPSLTTVGNLTVARIAVLEDLRQLLHRGRV